MRISAECAETLSPDLLESAIEERFKTYGASYRVCLETAGLFYYAKVYTLCLKNVPLLYYE